MGKFRHPYFPLFLILIFLISGQTADAQKAKTVARAKIPQVSQPRRRVYVLHSGVHTILSEKTKNLAAETLQKGLLHQGVEGRDIIVMDNPYPSARWYNMFPVECMTMFVASALPGSGLSQECYLRLDRALRARGVKPDDDVVWIGHSAGGQIGLTMGYLSRNLDKFPALARRASPYHFDMVILLGSPVGLNLLPPDVKLRHYFSPQDRVVHWLTRYGTVVLKTLGYRIGIHLMPSNLNPDDRIRIFEGVEHPYWDVDSRVLNRILAETNPGYRPLWQSPAISPGLDMALMRLVSRALEDRYHLTFEDPLWKK